MTKKKRAASMGELGDLHKMVAVYLKNRIQESMPNREFSEDELVYNDETGEYEKPFIMPLSSAELGNAITFLRNNEVTAEPDDETLADLRDEFSEDFKLKREKKAQAILARTEEEAEQANWI